MFYCYNYFIYSYKISKDLCIAKIEWNVYIIKGFKEFFLLSLNQYIK